MRYRTKSPSWLVALTIACALFLKVGTPLATEAKLVNETVESIEIPEEDSHYSCQAEPDIMTSSLRSPALSTLSRSGCLADAS